jgi:very-short-patch-repair endonuclease
MRGRGRPGLTVHESSVNREERATRSGIPVTSVARTLFDLAEVLGPSPLERSFEEADRLKLLELRAVEAVCERNPGRRAIAPIRRLVSVGRAPTVTRSSLEDDFVDFCREQELPAPVFNATVLGFEVDALWPDRRLVVELDGFRFHHHRGAFERDRERDAALQAAGYRVIRLTHRRLGADRPRAARQLRALLG